MTGWQGENGGIFKTMEYFDHLIQCIAKFYVHRNQCVTIFMFNKLKSSSHFCFFKSFEEIGGTEDLTSYERCGTDGDRQLMFYLAKVGFCKYSAEQKVNKCFSKHTLCILCLYYFGISIPWLQ
jgi:hypothetical protein